MLLSTPAVHSSLETGNFVLLLFSRWSRGGNTSLVGHIKAPVRYLESLVDGDLLILPLVPSCRKDVSDSFLNARRCSWLLVVFLSPPPGRSPPTPPPPRTPSPISPSTRSCLSSTSLTRSSGGKFILESTWLDRIRVNSISQDANRFVLLLPAFLVHLLPNQPHNEKVQINKLM